MKSAQQVLYCETFSEGLLTDAGEPASEKKQKKKVIRTQITYALAKATAGDKK